MTEHISEPVNEQSLLTYDIQKLDYQGLPVYRQIGDMSAGFGVLKTIVAFDQGIAATMEEAPQGGTYPVAPTPEFLQRSVRKTVEPYNSEIGACHKDKESGGWNGDRICFLLCNNDGGSLFTYSLSGIG